MSDIPDWLVELAAQGGPDEEEEGAESAPEPVESESSDAFTFAPEPQTVVEPLAVAPETDEDESAQDLMETLRNQVEAEEAEEEAATAEKPSRSFSLRLPGLLPWQQLVLTVLFLLDVIVIGLLILVMLGRVSIP
ncbi:MAG: hypothetical protein JXC32_18970 [Anaerolineae bacterium]|nr:hypothetical protein [Anaerolineae bacterium]